MEKQLRMAVCGDFCAYERQEQLDEVYSKTFLSEIQPILDSVDYRIVNLENSVAQCGAPIRKCGPNLNADPKNLIFLTVGGFDCAIVANNHTGDFGEDALKETLRRLDGMGVAHVGAGNNVDEAYCPVYVERCGLTVGVIAICENEFGTADLEHAGSAGFDLFRTANAIREAKQKADFVLVINHGGNEYNPLPSPRVVGLYRTFTMLGADVVIGMHPHCPQGTEVYENKPIAYSTGNFFFYDPSEGASWYYGYVPILTFTQGKPVKMEIVPYHCDAEWTHLEVLQGERKAAMDAYMAEISAPIADEKQLRRLYDGWCTAYGPNHMKSLTGYQPEFYEMTDFPCHHPMYATRGTLTCEAHNEMITYFARMVLNGRQESGKEMVPEIRRLQRLPLDK